MSAIRGIVFVFLSFACSLGVAQVGAEFPNKPIKIIVPFGPGGIADLTARVVAVKLSESLKVAVLIENKPGAGGIVAGNALLAAEPDGHTLLLISNATAVSSGLFKSLPFDPQKDFAPISTVAFFDMALVTGAQSRFTHLADLLNYAKSNPGKLNIGSINIGSTQNLAAELFKSTAGIDAQVVPYNGTPAVVTALRSGDIDVAIEILGPVMGQVNSKVLRPLAVLSERRSLNLPEAPTAKEGGLNLLVSSWNGLAVSAKVPKAVVQKLHAEIVAVLGAPDVKKRMTELNVEARASTAEQASELLSRETRRWSEVIVRAKVERQ